MKSKSSEGSSNTPVLELDNVRAHFMVREPHGRSRLWPRSATLYAVDGVSFAIQRGETMGLIGESGSGKSTLGRMIVGLTKPTSGRVLLQGHDITQADVGDQVRGVSQMVFQNPRAAVNPRRKIREILSEPLRVRGIGSIDSRQARSRELLDLVGLPQDSLDRYPSHLSGGQLQRVCIARALSTNPDLLVADEPTASLDASVRAQIMNLFKELQERLAIAILFISHDLGSVSYLADTLSVMYLGRVVESGPKAVIESNPLHPYTQSLLASASVRGRRASAEVIKGEVPSAVNRPSGCYFHPRCPVRVTECFSVYPTLEMKESRHFVACHVAPSLNPLKGPDLPTNQELMK